MTPTFPDFPHHLQVPAGLRSWHRKEISQYLQASISLSYVTGWDLAVDIGAFGGVWSYAFAKHFKAVHTFEPSVRNTQCIVRNLARYPHVTVHNVALMDQAGRGVLKSGGGKYEFLERQETGDISVTTLDSFTLPACNLLKVDAEGADTLVLQGAERTIAKYHPVIIAEEKESEVWRFGLAPGAVHTLLTGWGYERVWAHAPDGIYARKR